MEQSLRDAVASRAGDTREEGAQNKQQQQQCVEMYKEMFQKFEVRCGRYKRSACSKLQGRVVQVQLLVHAAMGISQVTPIFGSDVSRWASKRIGIAG